MPRATARPLARMRQRNARRAQSRARDPRHARPARCSSAPAAFSPSRQDLPGAPAIADRGLRIADRGLRIADRGLRIADRRLRIADPSQDLRLATPDLRLATRDL